MHELFDNAIAINDDIMQETQNEHIKNLHTLIHLQTTRNSIPHQLWQQLHALIDKLYHQEN